MIINLKSQTDLSSFYVIYEGSTNLEKPGWYGISHLLEHCIYHSFDDYIEEFERDGIEHNAYTSSNEIVFHLSGLDEKLKKWQYKFIDLLAEFKTTKEQFENEKKIVLEEYLDSFNDQTESHVLNLSRKLFNDFNPIGLRQDLENIKYMDCLNFFELQFTKPSKIINVSKNKDYKNNIIDFSDKKINNKLIYGDYNVPLELNNKFKDKTSVIVTSPVIDNDFAYINFINSMLSLGLKSPLYQEIREKKGLVYYIHCYQTRSNKQSINLISTQTSNKNYEPVIDSIRDVISNPSKYLTKDRFDIVKDYYKVRMKKDEILRYKNVNQWINPPEWSIYNILNKVNINKIKEIYEKYYDFSKFYISNDKTEFKNQ